MHKEVTYEYKDSHNALKHIFSQDIFWLEDFDSIGFRVKTVRLLMCAQPFLNSGSLGWSRLPMQHKICRSDPRSHVSMRVDDRKGCLDKCSSAYLPFVVAYLAFLLAIRI